jgi:hypothetical protein
MRGGNVASFVVATTRDFWATPWGVILGAIIGGVIVLFIQDRKEAASRRWRNWRKPRSEANRRKEVRRREERLALITDYHDHPGVLSQYILDRLIVCVRNLGAFLLLGVVGPNLLTFLGMLSQGMLGDVGATVLQLLSIVPLSRLIVTADRAIAIAFDVRNYESYQEHTLRGN